MGMITSKVKSTVANTIVDEENPEAKCATSTETNTIQDEEASVEPMLTSTMTSPCVRQPWG